MCPSPIPLHRSASNAPGFGSVVLDKIQQEEEWHLMNAMSQFKERCVPRHLALSHTCRGNACWVILLHTNAGIPLWPSCRRRSLPLKILVRPRAQHDDHHPRRLCGRSLHHQHKLCLLECWSLRLGKACEPCLPRVCIVHPPPRKERHAAISYRTGIRAGETMQQNSFATTVI